MDSQFAEHDLEHDRVPVDERSSSGGELLSLPVCVNGAELGRPTDLLLDESAYYREHGASLLSLRGASVDLAGRRVGALADIMLRPSGEVTRIVVKRESGTLRRLRASRVRIRRPKATRR